MDRRRIILMILILCSLSAFNLYATKPGDFTASQVDSFWTNYLWKSGDPKIQVPKVEKLSERDVVRKMAGEWTVPFGVIPDKLTLRIGTNKAVEVSGVKEGKAWKKKGEWRVISDKLVFFFEQDPLPVFVFWAEGKAYMFDPWAQRMKAELKRNDPERTKPVKS